MTTTFMGQPLQQLVVHPGDIFVLHSNRILSKNDHEMIQRVWAQLETGAKLLVLDAGHQLKVIREAANT